MAKRTRVEDTSDGSSQEEPSPEPKKGSARRSAREGGSSRGSERSQGSQNTTSQSQARRPAPTRRGLSSSQADEDGGASDVGEESQFQFTQSEPERWVDKQKADCIDVTDKDLAKGNALSKEETDNLVGDMARFILLKGSRKEAITKKHLMDEVLGQTYRKKQVFKFILDKANRLLRNTVNMTLVTGQANKPWSAPDTFYLINQHVVEGAALIQGARDMDDTARALLMMTLGLIYCQHDRKIMEDVLLRDLNQVDPNVPPYGEKPGRGKGKKAVGAKDDATGLGDVAQHLQTFVRQNYLRKEIIANYTSEGEPMAAWSMGARAYLEVGRRQIVHYIAESLGQTPDETALEEVSDDDDSEDEEEGDSQEADRAQ